MNELSDYVHLPLHFNQALRILKVRHYRPHYQKWGWTRDIFVLSVLWMCCHTNCMESCVMHSYIAVVQQTIRLTEYYFDKC